jgi:hypothetical protein
MKDGNVPPVTAAATKTGEFCVSVPAVDGGPLQKRGFGKANAYTQSRNSKKA